MHLTPLTPCPLFPLFPPLVSSCSGQALEERGLGGEVPYTSNLKPQPPYPIPQTSNPTPSHGVIIDTCFQRMNDFNEELATRAYATRVLQRFTHIYPEITGELISALQILIENSKETLSKYSKNILKEL
jgi:hypothetical protein